MEHPDKKFKINCIKDPMTDNFIQTIQQFCKTILGREDMFEYVKVENSDKIRNNNNDKTVKDIRKTIQEQNDITINKIS